MGVQVLCQQGANGAFRFRVGIGRRINRQSRYARSKAGENLVSVSMRVRRIQCNGLPAGVSRGER